MAELKRKRGESFESFLRRFNRRLQQSGKLIQARKVRFFQNLPNKTAVQKSTLVRKKIREKREYLKKIGKLKDEPEIKGRQRR